MSKTGIADVIEDSRTEPDAKKLEVTISNGKVEAKAGKPGEVTVRWRITRDTQILGKSADPSTLEIHVERQGDGLNVYDKYTGPLTARHPKLELWIEADPAVPVTAELGNGTLGLGLPAIASAHLGNGTLSLDGELISDAPLTVDNGTISGSLTVRGGSHEISIGNGTIKLALSKDSSVAVNASAGNGAVELDGFAEQQVKRNLTSSNGSGKLNDGTGSMKVSAGNGKVALSVAK